MDTEHTCAMCGEGPLHLVESEQCVEFDGTELRVPFRSHACNACGSKQALDDDLRLNARAMRRATKEHYQLLTGQQVREVRKSLGLSQEQAAKLFGGGPVAFSKYENDEITQSEAMDRLIWLVGQCPWLLEMLAKRLKLILPGEARITIERSRSEFRYEVISDAVARGENKSELLRGFSDFSFASNDGVYRAYVDPRPAKRLAA
jgi:HTH-type transcriptional regulator / antitoxin MqsA